MESQEYRAALARTRQAISVQKAIQLKNEGSQARCAYNQSKERSNTGCRVLHRHCLQCTSLSLQSGFGKSQLHMPAAKCCSRVLPRFCHTILLPSFY